MGQRRVFVSCYVKGSVLGVFGFSLIKNKLKD